MTSPLVPAASALRPRNELAAWRNAIFVIFTLSGLSIATWAARLPEIKANLDVTTGSIGILILGMSAGSILGLMASAWLMARMGARSGMVLSLSFVAVGLVLIGIGAGIVFSPVLVFVGLALFGFGNGSVDVMMNVEGAAAETELGKTVLPLMHACFSLGTVIGAGIGAAASALQIGVAWHAIAMAVIIAVAAVIAVRFVPVREELGDETAPHASKPDWKARLKDNLSVWADLRLILIGVIMLGMAFAEGSANDWLALAAVEGHGLSEPTGAIVFGVFVSAMTVGRVAGGPLIDRFGRVRVLQVSAVSAMAGLLIFILGTDLWLIILGTALWGLGSALGFPLGMSAAAEGKNAAARVSAVAMIGYLAFLVGPPLIGLLGDAVGLLNALFVVLVLVVLSGLASPAAREREAKLRSRAD
ncbi:MFS transporter [Mycetocola manganoxydans]|uniref:MFS transporter n=1 Tax=Mycetocola manganoxydans TaxID=699879 RepID=A0A3L6ZUH7_9MICO|nr:MFS transporter [Mycetocola manganoxydans]RLP71469.1 MFS transporter [Mycetocola manganoxydans]GHD46669.1 MFS transporter [Mycetocola manganoxydans]